MIKKQFFDEKNPKKQKYKESICKHEAAIFTLNLPH